MKFLFEFPFHTYIYKFWLKRNINHYQTWYERVIQFIIYYSIILHIKLCISCSISLRITKGFRWHLKVHEITIRFWMIGSIEAGNYKSTRPKNSRHFPHTYRQDYLCWCNRRYAPIRIIDNVEKDCCILEEKSTWAILEAFCKFYLVRKRGCSTHKRLNEQFFLSLER